MASKCPACKNQRDAISALGCPNEFHYPDALGEKVLKGFQAAASLAAGETEQQWESRQSKIRHPSGDDGGDGTDWLPGMWEQSELTGGQEEVRPSSSNALVRSADAAQYARPPIPEDQRGQIRVRLLNATPDPLGSVAALCEQYKGNVIRSLSEVTDDQRRACLDDMGKTVLNGPLEVVQFHFQIEGVTRSITHQMVRSRASFFAQESLRFAVPEGSWSEEIPLPPSISGDLPVGSWQWNARRTWQQQMDIAQIHYARLIELGMPAEEARGILPHDMPTRIHWVLDLRTLLAEAGKRTCTQAQQPWRIIFAGMAKALREYGSQFGNGVVSGGEPEYGCDEWQFHEIANRLRPVCFQTGSCGFMAAFDRSCKIRSRVEALGSEGLKLPSQEWSTGADVEGERISIQPWEWAADPSAARS